MAVVVAAGLWGELRDGELPPALVEGLRAPRVLAQIWAAGQASTNYHISADVADSGGDFRSSANYQVIDSVGRIGGVSSSATYQVRAGYIPQLEEEAAAPPPAACLTLVPSTLTGPADGTQLAGLGTTLTWQNPASTTQYHIQVLPAPNIFTGQPDGPGINLIRNVETSFTIQPPVFGVGNYVILPGMTYSWRVRTTCRDTFAPLDDPSWGPASQRTFRTADVSSATISRVAPAEGSTVASLTPTLQWDNSNVSVFYYELQLSKDQSFNTDPATATASVFGELLHGGETTPRNSYTVRPEFPLEANTKYYWRMRPRVQGDGTPVAWSPTWSFRTP